VKLLLRFYDPIAEDAIFDKFVKLSVNKSAILISHRLSSIALVDKIMVLENGKIIEQGYHSELLKKNGKYSYLFNLQASKYLEEAK
jgi:ABC-type multidrug transport system fused ATPase/permease subunit